MTFETQILSTYHNVTSLTVYGHQRTGKWPHYSGVDHKLDHILLKNDNTAAVLFFDLPIADKEAGDSFENPHSGVAMIDEGGTIRCKWRLVL